MANEMRDRLVELICDVIQTDDCIAHCNYPPCNKCRDVADHLIENGVIVLPCKVRAKSSDNNCDTVKLYIEENKILQEDVKRLSNYIEALEYTLQKISGALDDINWIKE